MKKIVSLFAFFLLMQLTQFSFSQVVESDTNNYLITRNNGIEIIGKIISDDGREVLISTVALGNIYIPKSDIQSIKKIDVEEDIIRGEYRSTGAFTTRYQFSTNCFPIKKGENYALVNLYGPEVHFAVTTNFSVGIISTWIASPLVLALKYTIPTRNEKLNFGVGTLLGTTGYFNQGRGFGGLHWGMVTYGTRMNNLTFSAGISYLNPGRVGMNDTYSYYTPGIYPAIQDQTNPTNFYYDSNIPYQTINIKPATTVAPVLGLGGIASVGKKASFVFDAILFFGRKKANTYNQDVQYVSNPINSQPLYTQVGDLQTSSLQTIKSTALILMPGMRFTKNENRAFQVSLAGVVGKRNGNRFSFPIPMCTWFYKF
ncbi:MAG: hypothetical protein EBQ94_07465 [Flavobacteriales bacterium]|jgi:hypothetical protein|nr:hypothetical protein [Crocinitomicaceae bacterium]NBX80202.1 hypothetical protein [Flavobacteriales bacterium]NCA21230.1 hypothetical protein [Crocinitomicaceae bacterium]